MTRIKIALHNAGGELDAVYTEWSDDVDDDTAISTAVIAMLEETPLRPGDSITITEADT